MTYPPPGSNPTHYPYPQGYPYSQGNGIPPQGSPAGYAPPAQPQPSFNRAQARAEAAAASNGMREQKGGNYWRVSKQEAGTYKIRPMPPHPQKAPQCLEYHPEHWIGAEKVMCLLGLPDALLTQYGSRQPDGSYARLCHICECLSDWGEIKQNNPYQYQAELPDPRMREILEKATVKQSTYLYALLLQANMQIFTPPQPIIMVVDQKSVLDVLDTQGLGRMDQPIDLVLNHFTSYETGHNFILTKTKKDKYAAPQWDAFPTPVPVPRDLFDKMMYDYPDLTSQGKSNYKTYEEQNKILVQYRLAEPM